MKPSRPMTIFLICAAAALLAVMAVPSGDTKVAAEPEHSIEGSQMSGAAIDPTNGQATDAPNFEVTADQLRRQRERMDQLDWGLDPFAGPASEHDPEPEPEPAIRIHLPPLTGISIRGDMRRAIIGNNIVEVGDRLPSGFTIKDIEKDSVTLERDAQEHVLRLGDQ